MFLDIFTTILGVIYLLLEYRASIYLWYVGMLMPALDIMLYWDHGLYGDAGMAVYYLLAAVYGWYFWKFGKQKTVKGDFPISHMPLQTYLPAFAFFLLAWWGTYELLVHFTNSDVPVLDAFTNALSFVGLLAHCRCHLLLSLRRQGYPLQGWALRLVHHYSRGGLLQMVEDGSPALMMLQQT